MGGHEADGLAVVILAGLAGVDDGGEPASAQALGSSQPPGAAPMR
jgi:hypothetical protein